jgi:hypothetical protein
MTTPRRRLIRPTAPAPTTTSPATLLLQKLRSKLDKDRQDLARWMSRLKRAFTFVQKHHGRIARLERQITKLGGG